MTFDSTSRLLSCIQAVAAPVAAFGLLLETAGAATTSVASPAPAAPVSVLPSAPDGSESGPVAPAMALGNAGDGILDGFAFSATLGGTYDSNVNRGPGGALEKEEDDFYMRFGGSVDYMSKSTDWTFGGSYKGSYDSYFSNSDNSGFNHDADAVVNYEGGRLKASAQAGVDITRGFNRFYSTTASSSFIEVTNYTTALTARYRASPKSSVVANIGQRFSTADSDAYQDTESFDIGTSALWKFSPLTEMGPGLRYTYRAGSSQTGRSAVGPTLSANYKLSAKVVMNSRVGVDFPWLDDGRSLDPTVSAAIGLNYKASKLWGMNFSLYRDNQADPSAAGNFYELTAARLGYTRTVRRATLSLGLGYETMTYESISGAPKDDRDYVTLDGSVKMPVLTTGCEATFFMKHSQQDGAPNDTWDAFQTGISISRKF